MENVKPYVVLEAIDRGNLEAQVEKLYALGYVATGGVSNGDRNGTLFQAMVLKYPTMTPTNGDIRLKEPAKQNGKARV